MKRRLVLIMFLMLSMLSFAQEKFATNVKANKQEEKKPEVTEVKRIFDVGFGFGLDYGGFFGAKGTFVPVKYLGLFVSAGYHLIAFGWQLGVTGFILPKNNIKKVRPYGKVMFGSNRVIIVQGASSYNKNYIGFTPGAGVEFRFGSRTSHGLNVDLNFPVSSSEFRKDLDELKNNPAIDISNPAPIAISIGYHFEF